MTSTKCKNCGTTEIDVHSSLGVATCTKCGTVLESNAIVNEVQFIDTPNGGSLPLGQFVSSESRGPRFFGGKTFHYEFLKESREQTRENARKALNKYGQQLRLDQNCIDMSFNFYKLALAHNFTCGHKATHVLGACLYLACRAARTDRLLIDCCDVLLVHFYDLGRTYLKLSKVLRISIPPLDPCLYIMRFASHLGFGEQQHTVSMTALQLVQRMKKDWLHIGRRQTGICGAALLLAARMHNFNRTVDDVIKIVRVHESTLKKRLLEFGETPSGSLTFDEFMTVDLEEEQDPPCYKTTKIKEQERIKKHFDDENTLKCVFRNLQAQIEKMKEIIKSTSYKFAMPKSSKDGLERREASQFTEESVVTVINEYLDLSTAENSHTEGFGLGPNIDCMNLVESLSCASQVDDTCSICSDCSAENDLNKGIDDTEIDSYILAPMEIDRKEQLWNKVNADYVQAQKMMGERKPEKRKRKTDLKKSKNLSAKTAGEAINKMLKKKKISTKINYDVLKDVSVKDFKPRPEHRKSVVSTNPDEAINEEALQERLTDAVSLLLSKNLAESNEMESDVEELDGSVDFEDDPRSVCAAISLSQIFRRRNNSPDRYSEDYSRDDEY